MVKKILVPISFSRASVNSMRHAAGLYPKAKLTLLHCYPVQKYSRRYDFGQQDYDAGIKEKLGVFYDQHLEKSSEKPIFLSQAGAVSDVLSEISSRYDLMVMTRKSHPQKKSGYFSEKQLFIIARSACPVLIMPVTDTSFHIDNIEHIWYIQRRDNELEVVDKGMGRLGIQAGQFVTKSFTQRSFASAFWKYLIAYETSRDQKLLGAIDQAHETEPIDLIVLVDYEQSLFINFLKSDTIRIFCEYEIPILVFPASAGSRR